MSAWPGRSGTLFVNGKFAAQPLTGVQRVAGQLLRAVDAQLAARSAPRRWVLLCPAMAPRPQYRHIDVRHVGLRGLPLHLWEQAVLPWAARGGALLNLAGSSPALGDGQLCMVHDAAVFDQPAAYRPAFVAWYRWLFRRQARRAGRLLTVSAFSQGRLAQHLGLAPERIEVVPDGGDHLQPVVGDEGVLDRLGLRSTPFVLAVGSANPNKNHARLLAAMDRLTELPALRLVLVGGGAGAVFAAGAAPAHARVTLAGPQGDAALKSLYGHALGFVFPSLYEGFGLPPLEAMSCGCPVAASHAASLPEVCGDAALYFDPLSVDAIADAIRRLVGEPALRQRLVEAGNARVAALSWRASAEALLAAVERPS